MLNEISRTRVVGMWFAAVAVVIASVVAWGVNVSVGTIALLLSLSLLPPAILLIVWRVPSQTIAEILYTTNTPKGRS